MTMAGIEYYENQAGLLENLPGWQFVDWVPSWQGGVAPCPGMLAALQATHPHPHGSIIVNLHFVNGHAAGTVRTPVEGSFVFGNQKVNLVPGLNEIR